jgi:hypothetical protein
MNVDGASFLLLVCLVIDVISVAEIVKHHLSEERLRPRITLRGLLVLMRGCCASTVVVVAGFATTVVDAGRSSAACFPAYAATLITGFG